MYFHVCGYVYVHREARGGFLVSSLTAFFFYLLRQDLTLSLEFDVSVALAKPVSLHFLPLQHWGYRQHHIYPAYRCVRGI